MFVLSRDPVPKADPKYPKCLPTLMLIAVATWVHDVPFEFAGVGSESYAKRQGQGQKAWSQACHEARWDARCRADFETATWQRTSLPSWIPDAFMTLPRCFCVDVCVCVHVRGGCRTACVLRLRTIGAWKVLFPFFPRASERRVLPIVEVCISSSHLHTFSSSHLLSHLLIFTSSLTPSHLHIFSHTFSSSHLLSHLLIFTPSLSLTLSPFSLSFLSPFSLSRLLFLSLFRPRVVPAVSHETSTLSHEMRVDRQKTEVKLRFGNPFARNEGRSAKTEVKLRFYLCRSNPFARNEGRSAKNWGKIAIWLAPEQPFRTKWGAIVKKLRKKCDFTCAGATLSHEMRVDRQKTEVKIAILPVPEQPFRTKWWSIGKKLR